MSVDRVPLRDVAVGRWRGILLSLGFTERTLSGRHGPCPICDGGRDRFRFDDKDGRGTWICNVCGSGDGISLVMKTRRIDFKPAVALIEPLVGSAPVLAAKPEASEEDYRRWRNEVWRGARPVQTNDPVGIYLRSRVGLSDFPSALRHHPALAYADDGSRHPAMLAMITAPDGRPGNLHRTYLTADGHKAQVEKVRKLMPGGLPHGGAVRLAEAACEMGVAEGIETALAASALFDIPVWAAVNSVSLSKWQPPPEARRIVIFADNDAKFAGQHAAYQLANRLSIKDRLEVDVQIPTVVGEDWNDVLLAARIVELGSHPAPAGNPAQGAHT